MGRGTSSLRELIRALQMLSGIVRATGLLGLGTRGTGVAAAARFPLTAAPRRWASAAPRHGALRAGGFSGRKAPRPVKLKRHTYKEVQFLMRTLPPPITGRVKHMREAPLEAWVCSFTCPRRFAL